MHILDGRCFDRYERAAIRHGQSGVNLMHQFFGPRECELSAGTAPYHLRIASDGTVRGFVTVAARGTCTQHRYRRQVTAATYRLTIGCVACLVKGARFRVTGHG